MGNVFFRLLTARTGVVRRLADAVGILAKVDGMARTQLFQGPTIWMDWWRRATDDGIWGPALHITRNCSSVDVAFDSGVFSWRCDAISKEVGDVVDECGSQRLLFIPRTSRGMDDFMRRMVGF